MFPKLLLLIIFLTTLFLGANFLDQLILSPARIAANVPFGKTVSLLKHQPGKFSPPTISNIFKDNHEWVATVSASKKITMLATGDVILARSVNAQSVKFDKFTWAFENVAGLLKSGDVTFINLESPLLDRCLPTEQGMVFCGSSKHLQGLALAGIDIASLANNHAANFGVEGVRSTEQLLKEQGILVTGIAGPAWKKIKNVQFAFLGYNDITKPQAGISNLEESDMVLEITKVKSKADVVVVAIHWGIEYQAQPNSRQRNLAHLAIDAGADVIIGNHPHWVQSVEIYKGKLITYAHGNFIFDQEWSEKTTLGVVGKYTFFGKDLIDVEFLPVKIVNFGQPYFLSGIQKDRVLAQIKKESLILGQTP